MFVLVVSSLAFFTVFALLIAVRAVLILVTIRRRRRLLVQQQHHAANIFEVQSDSSTKKLNKAPMVLVVLGSGGHTAEMLTLISELIGVLPEGTRLTYVTGESDRHSASKASDLHKNKHMACTMHISHVRLPRAREVGEAWLSSVMSSVKTTIAAIRLVWRTKPDVVLSNGPGTSAVVAGAAFLTRVCKPSAKLACRVIYVESFARVETISMSGRILYAFADRFVVQWQQLCKEWPLAEYYGRLC